MHRTVWAAISSQLASTSGLPFLFFGAFAANHAGFEKDPLGGPIRPAGNMGGFPVITNRWLPATTDSVQAGKPFMIFGNLKAMAFGDKGDIRVGNFQSGTWGGKELSLSDQSGIVYKHPPRARGRSSKGVHRRLHRGVLMTYASVPSFPYSSGEMGRERGSYKPPVETRKRFIPSD
jgi:hypothetical protein